jgi:hypothetical protein
MPSGTIGEVPRAWDGDWCRATQSGGLIGLVVGIGAAAVMTFYDVLFLWTAWWSFVDGRHRKCLYASLR